MSERERGERADEQTREALEERAVDEEVERDEDEDEERDAEKKPRGPIGPWLSRSPASTLALAFGAAGVDLVAQLAPHAVEFEWRFDGRFDLALKAPLTFEAGERTLHFAARVSGRAGHDGLTELSGVTLSAEDGGGAVERITGAESALQVHVAGAARPVGMAPPGGSPDLG